MARLEGEAEKLERERILIEQLKKEKLIQNPVGKGLSTAVPQAKRSVQVQPMSASSQSKKTQQSRQSEGPTSSQQQQTISESVWQVAEIFGHAVTLAL